MKVRRNVAKRLRALATAAIALALPPAANALDGLSPILDCTIYTAATGMLRVHYGYRNTNSGSLTIPTGSGNFFAPSPSHRGQPFTYLPGEHHQVFGVDVALGGSLVWTLLGEKTAAPSEAPPCLPVDLSVTQSASAASVLVGDELLYQVTVRNHGGGDVPAVTISDTLPPDVVLISAPEECTGDGALVCALGDLAAGESVIVEIVVTPTRPGTLVNAVAATGRYGDLHSDNDVAVTSVTAVAPPRALTGFGTMTNSTKNAWFSGVVDPRGTPTTYFFEYGSTTAYGQRTAARSTANPDEAELVAEAVDGLKGGRKLHYRLVAESEVGTAIGEDRVLP